MYNQRTKNKYKIIDNVGFEMDFKTERENDTVTNTGMKVITFSKAAANYQFHHDDFYINIHGI